MAKLKQAVTVLFFLTISFTECIAQNYFVQYRAVDVDSSVINNLALIKNFQSRLDANAYMSNLSNLLRSKGFITSSIDLIQLDSSAGKVSIYLGEQYKWAKIITQEKDEEILKAVRWPAFNNIMDFGVLQQWQKKIHDHLEDNGFPFAKSYLSDFQFSNNEITATLNIEKGPIYKIDSIRVYGDARVDNEFLQRYLQISNGSTYNKARLEKVSTKLSELNYLEEDRPSDLTLLGTGSVLNLYLKNKRSSQINALVGFLPSNDPLINRKLLLTVDANVLLRNSLGSGETIGILWQQLQQRSPRLNLLYEQPYFLKTPFGLHFTFDMYKLDSLFLNVNMKLGAVYSLGNEQSATFFLLNRQSIVSGINSAAILQSRKLPQEADVSSLNLGVTYEAYKTDYRFNPRKGTELVITTSAGTKRIKQNNLVLELKDPSDPSFDFARLYDTVKQRAYQVRVNTSAAYFLPVGTQSTFKIGLNAGIFQSANYFRNELFQIGGYKLLRGFNEESQFVSQYAIGTLECRYIIGQNSAFFAFVDGGWGHHLLEIQKNHTYIGTGLGLAFQTKPGILNLVLANGKRDDLEFNLRQTKIHIGFVSYF